MGRTTLRLEDDAMEIARRYAERHCVSLGEAISDLVRKAAERPLITETRNGFEVIRLSRQSPKVKAALVDQLLDEMP